MSLRRKNAPDGEPIKELMDIYEVIHGRRSIRSFEAGRDVPEGLVRKLLEAACQAPSAGNVQPWRFFVVRADDLKQALCTAAGGQTFVAAAPVVIAVCVDLGAAAGSYGSRGRELYCLQDSAAAIEHILLAAHAEGLGACWVGAFSEAEAARALDLPEGIRPVALIPIGYPARLPGKRARLEVDTVTDWR